MDTSAIGAVTAKTLATSTAAPQAGVAVGKSAESAKDGKQGNLDGKGVEQTDDRTRDPRTLQFQVDKGTQQVVATIVDDTNRVVVRQIPDAEILRIAQAIDRMKGFLLESKA